MLKIAAIVGSLRKDSFNKRLAQAIGKLAAGKMEFKFVEIGDLPLFNQDLEASPPASVLRLRQDIKAADGILFMTPEHNRSISAALKNAIDWGSRPYGQSSWVGKPAATGGISPGGVGTAVAQAHLRSIVSGHLDMPMLGQPELFVQWREGMIAEDGSIANDDTRKFLQGFTDRFEKWVTSHAAAKEQAAA